MFWYYAGEQKTSLRTRTSQGEKEFDDSLLSIRRKQIGSLSKQQFLDLMSGRLTPEAYREHLIRNGIIRLR